jgi:hypothetical protein
LGVEVSGQLLQHFGDQVFRTVVPRNVRLAEAPSHGISIMQYDKTSRGALAYLALAGEILRQRSRAEKAAPVVAPAIAVAAIVEPNQTVALDLGEDELVAETTPTNDTSAGRDDITHQPPIEKSDTPDTESADG